MRDIRILRGVACIREGGMGDIRILRGVACIREGGMGDIRILRGLSRIAPSLIQATLILSLT